MVKGLAAVSALLVSGAAAGPSITSCGGADDLLQGLKVSLTPDPPVKGDKLTVQIDGTLTEAVSDVLVTSTLDVKALDLIEKKLEGTMPITTSPAVPAGPISITIGPSDLAKVPGDLKATGRLVFTSGDKQVTCVDVNLDVGSEADAAAPAPVPVEASSDIDMTFKNCGSAGDHISDISVGFDAGVADFKGTLDEPLTKFSVDFDVEIKKFFIKIPIKGAFTVDFTPGFPQGALETKIGPIKGPQESDANDLGISINGQVKVLDQNGEAAACIEADGKVMDAVVV